MIKKTVDDFIKTIHVDKSNFQYMAENGLINGSFLVDLRRVMDEYAAYFLENTLEKMRRTNSEQFDEKIK